MAKTSNETIKNLLLESYDPEYAKEIYALQRYAITGDRRSYGGDWLTSSKDLMDFEDIRPSFDFISTSNRILSNQSLMMMKVCYQAPSPDFPDLDPVEEEVRRGWLQRRWRGYGTAGEWGPETFKTFMDANGLGIGWTKVGLVDGATSISHYPLIQCIWDRHALHPGRSRFWAVVHYMPVEDAVARFGARVKSSAKEYGNEADQKLKIVRVIEYHDIGIGGSDPTTAFFLNDFGGKLLDKELNELNCLPATYCEHIHLWKMRRHVGRIFMELGSQEMRHALMDYITKILQRGAPFDVAKADAVDQDDLDALMDGVLLPMVKVIGPDGVAANAIDRKQAQEVPATVLQYLSILDREQSTESGNSDADRANLSQNSRTLGEIQQLQAGADIQTAFSKRQYAHYLQRLTSLAVKFGKKYDTAPISIPMQGQLIDFNVPEDPNSLVSQWLERDSVVSVNEDDLQYVSRDQRRAADLNTWMPLLGNPAFNQMEIAHKIIELLGEKDIEKFIAQMQMPMDPGGLAAQ